MFQFNVFHFLCSFVVHSGLLSFLCFCIPFIFFWRIFSIMCCLVCGRYFFWFNPKLTCKPNGANEIELFHEIVSQCKVLHLYKTMTKHEMWNSFQENPYQFFSIELILLYSSINLCFSKSSIACRPISGSMSEICLCFLLSLDLLKADDRLMRKCQGNFMNYSIK